MSLLHYLEHHFLTETQLLAAAGIGAGQLHALQAAGVMPQASYRLRLNIDCDSLIFGPHHEEHEQRYYAKGSPSWLGSLLLLKPEDAYEFFCRRYLARLQELGGGMEPDLAAEWGHFLSGTYGLCTRSGLPEDIAAKELAIVRIQRLSNAPDPLAPERRARLAEAVALLDAASSPFAPHERQRSSRHRYVDQMRSRYGL
ncbi:DUF6058 family natural product biosynthesis protein [Massilia sp. YIM B04103]|uniref:DUF6058 family natural product biosynthesis protein n=1 Tax=Massilia sp. YIM B04103 TaxID=2963106 RepID=UPI00210E5AB8|nr:DUF6058 family natural product biosynthesis protein [Massilia sp. YIM B04103]